MAMKDYPEILAAFNELRAKKQVLVDKVAPLRAKHDALQAQIDKLRDQQRAVGDEIKAIQRPAMVDIDMKLSAMARATGGASLNS